MRKLLLIFPLIAANLFGTFTHSISITIDHTKVGGSNISTYVAWVCTNGSAAPCDAGAHSNLSIPNLKVVGSGGAVTSASGFDVGFGSNPGCSSAYPFRLETGSYVGATGFGSWFVQVGTVSSSVDTVYYICFGDALITTDQSSATTCTTDSHFIRWYMLPMVANDSSKGGIEYCGLGPTEGWNGLGQATATYMNGASFVHDASNKGQTVTETGLPLGDVPSTFSMWFNATTAAVVGTIGIAQFANNNNGLGLAKNGSGKGYIYSTAGSGPASTTSINDGNWHYVVVSTNGVNSAKTYVDGVLEASNSAHVAYPASPNADCVGIGSVCNDGNVFFCADCKLDELRIRNDQITDGRVLADYNNQSSPWTFQTFGADTPVGGTVRHRAISN